MQSKAQTVAEYLRSLPDDRREAIEAVRAVILENLGEGYEEGLQYGMIGYAVPHSVYPPGYHCNPKQSLPFAGLASQKNHMAIYLMCVYQDESLRQWFTDAWNAEAAKGKAGKLDMGKGCVRFKKLEDVPLAVVGKAIKKVPVKKFIEHYESALGQMKSKPRSGKPAPERTATQTTKKTASKATKKPAPRKTAKKNAAR